MQHFQCEEIPSLGMEEPKRAEGRLLGFDLALSVQLSLLCICITMEILKEMNSFFIIFRISASCREHIQGRDVVKISVLALFIMIEVSWCQEQPNIIIAAVGSHRGSGSSLISETNFFVMLNKSCWASHLLRERQQYSSTSQWQLKVELNSILLQICICSQLDNCKINSSLNSMLSEKKWHGLCFNTSLHSDFEIFINLQSLWPLVAGSLIHQISQLPISTVRKKGEQIIYIFIIYSHPLTSNLAQIRNYSSQNPGEIRFIF